MKCFIYSLLAVSLLACSSKQNYVPQATQIADKYYSLLNDNKTDSVAFLFSEKFFELIDTEEYIAYLDTARLLVGTEKTHNLVKAEVESKVDSRKAERKLITLTYHTVYSTGYSANEQFFFWVEDGFSGKIDGRKAHKVSE